MGSKNKLKRFNQNLSFSNVIQPEREEVTSGEFRFKGKWRQDFFKNDRPIVVELGCGKGEYSVYLAQQYPEKNFVGVDIKGARFWAGAKESLELGLSNVGFLRTQIELIDAIFEENEVDYAHHDVYGNPYSPKHVTAIQTHYERLFMEKGRLITYLSFRFPNG